MAAEKERQVTVRAIKWHTVDGVAHEPNSTYSVAESQVDNLRNQGMAVPVDDAKPAAPPPPSVPPKA